MTYLREENGIKIKLYVQPQASVSEFQGLYGGVIKLRINARAVGGEANKAVLAFLSEFFAVPRNCTQIISGEKSRRKTVFISGNVAKLALKAELIYLTGSINGVQDT